MNFKFSRSEIILFCRFVITIIIVLITIILGNSLVQISKNEIEENQEPDFVKFWGSSEHDRGFKVIIIMIMVMILL
jgi:hypothetical protein